MTRIGDVLGVCASALCAVALLTPTAGAGAAPVPPCQVLQAKAFPAYGIVDGPPAVAVWRDIDLKDGAGCLGALRGRMELVVALAGRFRGPRAIEAMAQHFGAISQTQGLRYWSVTDDDWRTLLSEAFALAGPDVERRRSDFSAAEMLSGRALHTAQRDTRSTDLNLVRLVGQRVGAKRLVVESANVTPIRFLFIVLYPSEALRAIHVLDQLEPGLWGYYAVSTIRSGTLESDEKSFVNRADAFYRFLARVPADRNPPLAR